MRRIKESNGLELGFPESGPWIDIVPVRPSLEISIADAVAAILNGLAWHRWPLPGTKAHPLTKKMAGVVASNGDVAVRFLYPRGTDLLHQLLQVERAENGLHPALAGAILAALSSKQYPVVLGPSVIAAICSVPPEVGISRLNRTDIERLATAYIRTLAGMGEGVSLPVGAVDRARFYLVVSRLLWEQKTRALLAGRLDSDRLLVAQSLAASWADIQGGMLQAQVAGLSVRVSPGGWAQLVDLEGISPEALRFLLPDGKISLPISHFPPEPFSECDPALARGIASALIEEAKEGVYAPCGGFVLSLPRGFPLRDWGVSMLHVWAQPDQLWVGVEIGQHNCILEWRPGEPLRSNMIAPAARPLLEATLSALWRDLRVAGEEAVPAGGSQEAPTRAYPKERKRPKTRHRSLPARRYISVMGTRSWGTPQEREYTIRCAHTVRGHLRRLNPGHRASPSAQQIAREFGIALPPGCTFVRPYTRGGSVNGEKAPVITARGLTTVMMLLHSTSCPETNPLGIRPGQYRDMDGKRPGEQ